MKQSINRTTESFRFHVVQLCWCSVTIMPTSKNHRWWSVGSFSHLQQIHQFFSEHTKSNQNAIGEHRF